MYFGEVIGTTLFIQQFVDMNAHEWVKYIRTFNAIVRSRPNAAYATFTHGLSTKWIYLL